MSPLIRQQDPLPPFYQVRLMLTLEEAGLAKKMVKNSSVAMVSRDIDESHEVSDHISSTHHHNGRKKQQNRSNNSGKNCSNNDGRGGGKGGASGEGRTCGSYRGGGQQHADHQA